MVPSADARVDEVQASLFMAALSCVRRVVLTLARAIIRDGQDRVSAGHRLEKPSRTTIVEVVSLPDMAPCLCVAKTLGDVCPGQLHVKLWVHGGEDPGRRLRSHRRARQSSRRTTSAALVPAREGAGSLHALCISDQDGPRPVPARVPIIPPNRGMCSSRYTRACATTGGIADVNRGTEADHQPITATT